MILKRVTEVEIQLKMLGKLFLEKPKSRETHLLETNLFRKRREKMKKDNN
jgi:hypothetical protein